MNITCNELFYQQGWSIDENQQISLDSYKKHLNRTKTIKIDVNDIDYSKLLEDTCMGQMAEDFFVNLIFENKTDGTYIDVGAHDGVRFSNSFAFAKKLNWKGICVEAHPDYGELCRKNREDERNKVYVLACGNGDMDSVEFSCSHRGSLSTLNPDLDEFYSKNYKEWYTSNTVSEKINNFTNGKIKVPCKKLDTIIAENPECQHIDLMTIDVDGSEQYVFDGFDIKKHAPRVIILEVSTVRSVVEDFMKDTGYIKILDNNLNSIYCRDQSDVDLIITKMFSLPNITMYDPGHPVDN